MPTRLSDECRYIKFKLKTRKPFKVQKLNIRASAHDCVGGGNTTLGKNMFMHIFQNLVCQFAYTPVKAFIGINCVANVIVS